MVFGKGINDLGYSKTKEYQIWHSMIRRCYSEYYHKRKPTYIDVEVCDDWLTFSVFLKDVKLLKGSSNLMNGWVLDKDILSDGLKLYSLDTCCVIPPEINGIFGEKVLTYDTNLPQGVHYHKVNNRYVASCCIGKGRSQYLGSYKTVDEAREVYITCKKDRIISVANKFKGEIDCRVYDKLIAFKVK